MDSGTENGSVRMRRLGLAGVIGPVLSVVVFSVAGALARATHGLRQAISALGTWQWSAPHPPEGTFARAVDPARSPGGSAEAVCRRRERERPVRGAVRRHGVRDTRPDPFRRADRPRGRGDETGSHE